MKVWIMLPAFNEEISIPLMFPKIENVLNEKGILYRIVVVEDGSTDDTLQTLKRMQADYPLDIVPHKINRGLGETERDGFEYVAERSDKEDIIVLAIERKDQVIRKPAADTEILEGDNVMCFGNLQEIKKNLVS